MNDIGKCNLLISLDHFDVLKKPETIPSDHSLLESLARVGNPTVFEMPSVLESDITCDMSFSGIMN